MNTKKLMVAMRPNSAVIKAAVTIMIALTFGLACTSTTAYAKKKKVKYGTIEISTNPGGFPLRIDGQPQGDTSTTPRVIELEPGHHTVSAAKIVRDFVSAQKDYPIRLQRIILQSADELFRAAER